MDQTYYAYFAKNAYLTVLPYLRYSESHPCICMTQLLTHTVANRKLCRLLSMRGEFK